MYKEAQDSPQGKPFTFLVIKSHHSLCRDSVVILLKAPSWPSRYQVVHSLHLGQETSSLVML